LNVTDERTDLGDVIEEMSREALAEQTPHLRREQLSAYSRGEMTGEAFATAQEHLVWCTVCTSVLLAGDPRRVTTDGVSDVDIARAWSGMRARVQINHQESSSWPRKLPHLPLSFIDVPGMRVAAALLVAIIFLGSWEVLHRGNRRLADGADVRPTMPTAVMDTSSIPEYERQIAELRRQIEGLSEPQVNVFIADLYAAGATRSPEFTVTTINVPAGAALTLVMNTSADYDFPLFGVDILDRTGRRVTRAERLAKTAFGNFTLLVPGRYLPAGEYRLQLFGVRNGTARVLEEFVVRIAYL
jgi:hypothetical protein